jgi:hypothetical protein
MKRSFKLLCGLLLSIVFAANAQDPELNIDANANVNLVAGTAGVINVSVVNTYGDEIPANRVGVQLSTNDAALIFSTTQSGLPAGATVCSNTGGTIIINLPVMNPGETFTIAIQGVAATPNVNISANIEFHNPACTSGPPFVDDFSANNTSSAVVNITAATPVTLISFQGKAEAGLADLSWMTAEEEAFSHFEIEASTDALAFAKVGEVVSKGSNNAYGLTVPQSAELVYYRLKMVDHDGSFAYSKIIPVSLDEANSPAFLVYPNPTVDLLHIKNKVNGVIRIVDVTGKQVRTQKAEVGIQVIDVKNLREGVYYGWLNDQSFKFVKK